MEEGKIEVGRKEIKWMVGLKYEGDSMKDRIEEGRRWNGW